MTAEPFVSVILPVRDETHSIGACLATVLGQDYPPDRMEVVVAEGMSRDGTREALDQWCGRDSRLRVVDNPRGIVSAGLNAALRAARGEVVVRMDAHTEYASDYVRRCVEVLRETGADNVGGPWVARGTGYVGRAIAAAFQSPFAVGTSRGHNEGYEGPVDTVYLGCWRREVFERVGGFDEELVRNQDDEHSLRLTRAGGRVWQSPRIRSRYQPRASLAALFRQYMQYGYWKVRVIQKHRLPASFRHLVPGLFLVVLALLAAGAFFWSASLWACLGLAGLYLLGVAGASILTARRAGLSLLPVLPAVFWCYHFGYGCGFLAGLGDRLLRRGRPQAAFTTLTRPAAGQQPPAGVPAQP
jgi:glycosyltransferase involved in cell wall biosynthesis